MVTASVYACVKLHAPTAAGCKATWPPTPKCSAYDAFTHGFFKMQQQSGKAVLTDLRMGQAPSYVFSFALAEQPAGAAATANTWQPITPVTVGSRSSAGEVLRWLWPRLLGQPLPPPR